MALWLPPVAQRAQRAAIENVVLGQVELQHKLDHWNRELKRIDPYLEVVRASEDATHPSLKPGYYHVLRRPPVGQASILVHEGANGEFRDLDSGLFRTLQ